MKTCCRCKILQSKDNFTKRKTSKDGLRENCKDCHKKDMIKDKDKIYERQKEYRANNSEKLKERKSKYYHNNKEKARASQRRRYSKNYNSDPAFKVRINLRSRMNLAIKNGYKSDTTEVLIGCSIEYYVQYLESKFKEGMSWDDRSAWHIDHIRPCASFDLSDTEQQKICFHYTNTQPLWKEENLSKRDKW